MLSARVHALARGSACDVHACVCTFASCAILKHHSKVGICCVSSSVHLSLYERFCGFARCLRSVLPTIHVFSSYITLELLAGPPGPPGNPAFAIWANGAAQAAIAGGLRTPTANQNQSPNQAPAYTPRSPALSGVTNSPRLGGLSRSGSGSASASASASSRGSSNLPAMNLDAEALEMEVEERGGDGWSSIGAWALSDLSWSNWSGSRQSVGCDDFSAAIGTSRVEVFVPPTVEVTSASAASGGMSAARSSATSNDHLDPLSSSPPPPPPPPIDPLLCPPLRVKSVIGAPTLGAFVAAMGQPTDGAVSSV